MIIYHEYININSMGKFLVGLNLFWSVYKTATRGVQLEPIETRTNYKFIKFRAKSNLYILKKFNEVLHQTF